MKRVAIAAALILALAGCNKPQAPNVSTSSSPAIAPVSGPFTVTPEGTINLGYSYGSVRVQGLTIEEIQTAIQKHLGNVLRNPQVSVALSVFRGLQQQRSNSVATSAHS